METWTQNKCFPVMVPVPVASSRQADVVHFHHQFGFSQLLMLLQWAGPLDLQF